MENKNICEKCEQEALELLEFEGDFICQSCYEAALCWIHDQLKEEGR